MRVLILSLIVLFMAACGGERPAQASAPHIGQLDRVLASGTVRIGVKSDAPCVM